MATRPQVNGRPATFDHLRKKKPQETTVSVCTDPDLISQADAAQAEYHRAAVEGRPEEEIGRLRGELEAALEAVAECTVVMRFRSPGRRKYEELLLDHPPTEEQQKEYAEQYGPNARAPYNGDTIGPPLVALCCVEPRMTVEEATILFEGEYDEDGEEITPPWNMNELLPLFTAAMTVCNSSRIGELGKGFGATPGSVRS